jgi:hypothetical protein
MPASRHPKLALHNAQCLARKIAIPAPLRPARLRLRNGRVVLDNDVKVMSENEDIKEFYLGLSGVGQRKSYRDAKHYKRRKRWLS